MSESTLNGIEDRKMLLRFVKDLADNIECKEQIIDRLMCITKPNTESDVLNVIVKGVDTESGLITAEFLKSMLKSVLKKEDASKKMHEIIGDVKKQLDYSQSDDDVKDVKDVITDMEGLEEALLIKKGENTLLVKVLNVISNNDTAHAIVQRCAVNMNDSIALARTANNVKDKEIVYYMMEVLKKNGMLMNKEMLCLLRHDIVSILIYGMPSASDNLKPRLVENHEVAKILSYFRNHDDAIDILIYVSEPAAEILKCIGEQRIDAAIDNMVKDISLARRLNEIGADDIEELKRVFHYSERGMTVMLFKHLDDKVASVMMDPSEKEEFLIKLHESMAVPTFKLTEVYLQRVQETVETVDKVWRVYGECMESVWSWRNV
jgi:hypothetical protein